MLGGDGIWRDVAKTTAIFEGASKTYSRVENETYRVYGGTGIVTGTTFWGVEKPTGFKYDGKALFTYVFVKIPTGWKQVSAQHVDVK